MNYALRAFVIGLLLFVLALPALADTAKGQGVYMNFCTSCHANGIAGAPVTGNKAEWQERSAKGTEVIIRNALTGFQGKSGFMPAKGGNSALTDEEVTAAFMYMQDQSK